MMPRIRCDDVSCCGDLRPVQGGAEGTDERVMALHTEVTTSPMVKLAREMDESAPHVTMTTSWCPTHLTSRKRLARGWTITENSFSLFSPRGLSFRLWHHDDFLLVCEGCGRRCAAMSKWTDSLMQTMTQSATLVGCTSGFCIVCLILVTHGPEGCSRRCASSFFREMAGQVRAVRTGELTPGPRLCDDRPAWCCQYRTQRRFYWSFLGTRWCSCPLINHSKGFLMPP